MFDLFKKKQQTAREKLAATAQKNARNARDAIGEEKLNALKSMIETHQNPQQIAPTASPSPMEEAKKILIHMNKHKVADNLLALIREKSS